MLTVMPIRSIAYHDAQANEAERQSAIFRGEEASRNLTSSYYDQDVSGARGQWLLLGTNQGFEHTIFKEILTGAPVISRQLHALAAGAAITNERSLRVYSGDRRAGYDSVFSAPKSVSILTTFGDHALTRAVVEAHENAVKQTMEHAFRTGCIEVRTGAAGRARQVPKAFAAAMYTHFLSRENDPQLHSHVVILNAALREDGTVSAIDNLKFMRMRAVLGARYRAALADNLYTRLGLESKNVERNFELIDVHEPLNKQFSKRKQQIDRHVAERGKSTSQDRALAQQAAYDTRQKKQTGLLLPQLQRDWQRQMHEAGFSAEQMLKHIKSRANTSTITPTDRDQLLRVRTDLAISDLAAKNCVIPIVTFEQTVFEAGQSYGNVAAIERVADHLKKRFITDIKDDNGGQFHIAKASIQLEHQLLKSADEGRNKWHQSPSLLDTIIRRTDLSEEQRAAALHALNSDLIAVVEGSPGSGKSHLLGAVAAALRETNFRLFVCAPSHKATTVIRDETKSNVMRSLPIQTLAARLQDNTISFNRNDVIIVDEAGMAALDDVNELVQAGAKAGAKIILSGDTRQLQPVGAGAPMLSLARVLGSVRVDEIRRQKISWMRTASQNLATGNVDFAIQEYRNHGALKLYPNIEDTLSAAANRAIALAEKQTQLPLAGAIPLVMTHRRKDVLVLNAAIREKLKQRGELATSVIIEAMTKGENEATRTEIAVGDKISFCENINPGGTTINNGEIAHITGITEVPNSEPIVHFQLHRNDPTGRPLTFSSKPSDLVGYRHKGMPRVPRLQHAYAQTIHAAQGATVDRAILVCTARTSAEQILVGMTRHRLGLSVMISADRLLPKSTDRQLVLNKDNEIINIDHEPPQKTLSESIEAQALQRFIREASERESKHNPSDFIKDVGAWLRETNAIAGFQKWHRPSQMDSFKARMHRASKSFVQMASLQRKSSDAFNAKELSQIEVAHHKDPGLIRDITYDHDVGHAVAMALGRAPMRTVEERSRTLHSLSTRTKTALRDKLQLWVLNPIAAALKRIVEADNSRKQGQSTVALALHSNRKITAEQQIIFRQMEEDREHADVIRKAARRRSLILEILNSDHTKSLERQSRTGSVEPWQQGTSVEPSKATAVREQPLAKASKGWLAAGLEKVVAAGRNIINANGDNTNKREVLNQQPTGEAVASAARPVVPRPPPPTSDSHMRKESASIGNKKTNLSDAEPSHRVSPQIIPRTEFPFIEPIASDFKLDPKTGRLVPMNEAARQALADDQKKASVRPALNQPQPDSSQGVAARQSARSAMINQALAQVKQREPQRPPSMEPTNPERKPQPKVVRKKDDGMGM